MAYKVRIWDLPTRAFHWLLVGLLLGMAISGYTGGDAMQWHARMGYALLSLLLFRIAWGFVGGRWSRFRAFVYSPRSVLAYLRGKAPPDHLIGHNPLGAGSVLLMLTLLLVQIATGLLADDEISFTGPLNKFVASSKGLAATWYHKRVGQWLILGLVALHIGAVLYYQMRKRRDVIGPMLNGDKVFAEAVEGTRDTLATRLCAVGIFLLCMGGVLWAVRLAG